MVVGGGYDLIAGKAAVVEKRGRLGLSEAQLEQRVGESWLVLGNIERLYGVEMFAA